MEKQANFTLCGPDMHEFTDTGVNDPAEFARITKASRRPVKMTRWFRWLIAAGALVAALICGFLLGHLVT
jgi:hypothetical protein